MKAPVDTSLKNHVLVTSSVGSVPMLTLKSNVAGVPANTTGGVGTKATVGVLIMVRSPPLLSLDQ